MKKLKRFKEVVFANMLIVAAFFPLTIWAESPAVPAGTETAPVEGAAAGAAQAAASSPSAWGMLLPLVIMFGLMWLLMIRPQQKKQKEQQQMLGALQHGDEVVTTSGMIGKITGIADKVVTVEVADNVRIKMLKSQVSQVVKGQIKDTV